MPSTPNNPNTSEPIYSYQPLFGSWYVDEQIGKGAFGTVYKVKRQEEGFYAESAVKIITFPSDEYYRDTQSIIGKNKDDLYEFFSSQLDSIRREINILHKLRFHPNIVIYEDHKIIQKEDRLSWDILIRMEYLKSLPSYLDDNSMTIRQVAILGIDILTALSECNRYNIVHRDIKDQNIFITDKSAFKLGDFGIAKELSKSASVASFHGTPLYVSPEVARQEEYDIRSDIYSLGIVIYKLLNNLRIPFAPPYPDKQHPPDITNAVAKRLKGEPIKAPVYAVPPLQDIIFKACAYSRDDRYATPNDMIKDLESALSLISPKLLDKQVTPGSYIEDKSDTDDIFGPDKEEEIEEEGTDRILPDEEEEPSEELPVPVPIPVPWYKRTWAIATLVSVSVVILVGIVLLLIFNTANGDRKTASETASEVTAAVVETTPETTTAATIEEVAAAVETTSSTTYEEPTTTETSNTAEQNPAPTIKLAIIEGPISTEGGNICYYRVKATVTGDPAPTIIFSKDDSNGSFGSNVAQVNLSQGESYTLTASASNDAGTVSDSIKLEWANTNIETVNNSENHYYFNAMNLQEGFLNGSTIPFIENGQQIFQINVAKNCWGTDTLLPCSIGIKVSKKADIYNESLDFELVNGTGYTIGVWHEVPYSGAKYQFEKYNHKFTVEIISCYINDDKYFEQLEFNIYVD